MSDPQGTVHRVLYRLVGIRGDGSETIVFRGLPLAHADRAQEALIDAEIFADVRKEPDVAEEPPAAAGPS